MQKMAAEVGYPCKEANHLNFLQTLNTLKLLNKKVVMECSMKTLADFGWILVFGFNKIKIISESAIHIIVKLHEEI